MKILCLHGYFKFFPESAGQLARFQDLFEAELARNGDHFTFADLVDAPSHSIAGGTFLDADTSETFEGDPWEVMRANRLVYDFRSGEVVSLDDIDSSVSLDPAGPYFVAPGMILPGSVNEDGSRVTDYAAFFSSSNASFRYSEVEYSE
jgi:hypothetical protein